LQLLRIAAATPFRSAQKAARWIYGAGALPLSPRRLRRADRHQPLLSDLMHARLEELYRSERKAFWNSWLINSSPEFADPHDGPRFKTYISPDHDSLDTAVAELVSALCEFPVDAFKLVGDRHSSHRPDKLISYHKHRACRDRWAAHLCERLSDLGAHGVPFTTQTGDSELVSVAEDPTPVPGVSIPSWRSQLCERMGWSLFAAQQAEQNPPQVLHHVQTELHRLGIDVSRWQKFSRYSERACRHPVDLPFAVPTMTAGAVG
jgi:hypothetical protein